MSGLYMDKAISEFGLLLNILGRPNLSSFFVFSLPYANRSCDLKTNVLAKNFCRNFPDHSRMVAQFQTV